MTIGVDLDEERFLSYLKTAFRNGQREWFNDS